MRRPNIRTLQMQDTIDRQKVALRRARTSLLLVDALVRQQLPPNSDALFSILDQVEKAFHAVNEVSFEKMALSDAGDGSSGEGG